jgi:hypothetical protein
MSRIIRDRRRALLVAGLLLAACGTGHQGPRPTAGSERAEPTPGSAAAKAFTGRVTFDDAAAVGDVALVHDGKVVAVAPLGTDGSYTVAPPPGFAGGVLLARLSAPVVGVRAHPVDASPEPVSFELVASDAAWLRGELTVPDGVAFDWVDVMLTPMPEGIAPAAVLAEGTGPSLRAALVTTRVKTPKLELRVLRGIYSVRIGHWVDGPLSPGGGPINLGVAKLTLAGGETPEVKFGASIVTVDHDVAMQVQLRTLRPDER